MVARIAGLLIAVCGLIISLMYEKILKGICKKEKITEKDIVAVKSVGLAVAVVGAVVAVALG